ncbi:class I SAM-dependent methyltransferase [Gordonia caeni]|uniref:Class I SAM-dependent methyltransferase n=1 Tax=Gordonia caeni TaxID=1007097 RepID=A0ABP7P3K6_9ACTN
MAPHHHDAEMSGDYWEQRWAGADHPEAAAEHPYLQRELAGLTPGTAVDAGCGAGSEAIWLAAHGWTTTGADVSASALRLAADRADQAGVTVDWVHADLTDWAPAEPVDLVTTFYAHPEGDQLAFYRRLSDWVAPGGTLLVVGHLHHDGAHSEGDHSDGDHSEGDHPGPPEQTKVTADWISEVLPAGRWRIESATGESRSVVDPQGKTQRLHDAVVRATRTA